MKTVKELRDNLIQDYELTKKGLMDNQTANTLANTAGKIIKTAALELAYNQFTKQPDKKIDFLESEMQ